MNYLSAGVVTIEVREPYTTPGGAELSPGNMAKIPKDEFKKISQEDIDEYGIRRVGTMGLREDISDAPAGPSQDQLHRSLDDPNTPDGISDVSGSSVHSTTSAGGHDPGQANK